MLLLCAVHVFVWPLASDVQTEVDSVLWLTSSSCVVAHVLPFIKCDVSSFTLTSVPICGILDFCADLRHHCYSYHAISSFGEQSSAYHCSLHILPSITTAELSFSVTYLFEAVGVCRYDVRYTEWHAVVIHSMTVERLL